MNKFLFALILFLSPSAYAQKSYTDSLYVFLQNYVNTHEVVKGEDKKAMQFYPANEDLRVFANFRKATKSNWLKFATSGSTAQVYKVYGTLQFWINNKQYQLNVYQSQDLMLNEEYKNYLFLPFTDSTSGNETYQGGRYIDLSTADIQNNRVMIDFNKAYNPYCAYVSGKYNCPIPPKENAVPVAIKAGEKVFSKTH